MRNSEIYLVVAILREKIFNCRFTVGDTFTFSFFLFEKQVTTRMFKQVFPHLRKCYPSLWNPSVANSHNSYIYRTITFDQRAFNLGRKTLIFIAIILNAASHWIRRLNCTIIAPQGRNFLIIFAYHFRWGDQ